MEWTTDFPEQDPQHRHQSHLYGLYPGHHISVAGTLTSQGCRKIAGDKG